MTHGFPLHAGLCTLVWAFVLVLRAWVFGGTLRVSKGRAAEAKPGRIWVMTLNVAHGRKLALQQALLKQATLKANLSEVAAVLRRVRPDLVALQEADGPSFWSGDFDHVATLAREASYEHRFRGEHMARRIAGQRLSYGTALLSKLPLGKAASHTFASSRVTPRKGFVVATIAVPGAPGRHVTVASVHFDFLRKAVRRRQALTLAKTLKARKGPFIILGDLNCQWNGGEDTLRLLVEMLDVRAHEPEARDLPTFSSKRPTRRLDWILISPELEFHAYGLVPDKVSDHLGVLAEIGLK